MTTPYPPPPDTPGPDPTADPASSGYPPAPPTAPAPGQPQYPGTPPYPAQPQYPPTQNPAQPQYPPTQYPAQPQYPPTQYPPAQYPPTQYPPAAYPAAPQPGAAPAPGVPAYPGGYVPVPGTPGTPPPKQRSKVGRVLASIGSVVVIACAVGAVKVGVPALLDALDQPDPAPTHAQPSGIYATSDAKAAPTAPFEDTPAAEYPEGEAGITLPKALAVSGFSKAKVEAALKKVKKALIAGRLDPKMLVEHDASTLIGLLAPDAREDIEADFTKQNFFVFATQIAPGHTLTSDPVRVSGRVTFRANTQDDGVRLLEVITNFVWVYPFAGELKTPGDHLVVVHDEVTWAFPADADVIKSARGMWITSANGFASNMDCDLLDQSLVGLGKPQLLLPGQSQDEDAPFDPNGTLDIVDTC